MKLILTTIAILLIASSAQASYWLECKVKVRPMSKFGDNNYSVIIMLAKVTDGHLDKGKPCLADKKHQEIDITIDKDLELNKNTSLKYTFKEADTVNGVIRTETWTKWPFLGIWK